jgi:phospholipid transport system substrate-binding protein
VWASSGAETLIKSTTNEVLNALKADSSQIYSLVEKIVLPHFDFERMSKLVLAKNWRRITDDQKIRFANEFSGLLVRTYSAALVEAAGKVRKFEYSTVDKGSNPPRATVSSKVYQKGKPKPIEVDYDMYSLRGQWKVYNLKVGGVSLVNNYRTEFAKDINKMGIEGLINKLKNKNRK